MSWKAFLGGRHARMFLSHYLLTKEFLHTVPQFSNHARQVKELMLNKDENIVFNDDPHEITRIHQIIEEVTEGDERLISESRGE